MSITSTNHICLHSAIGASPGKGTVTVTVPLHFGNRNVYGVCHIIEYFLLPGIMLRVFILVVQMMALSYFPTLFLDLTESNNKDREILTSLLANVTLVRNKQFTGPFFQSLQTDVTRSIKDLLRHGITKDIGVSFTPNHAEDNKLKLDLKYETRNFIQVDITATIRIEMISSMRKTVVKVMKKTLAPKPYVHYKENLCDKNKKLPPHQRVLSYSIFGPRQFYYEGIPLILREAAASNLYHDWRIRIYHDDGLTNETKTKYADYKNLDFCDVRYLPRYGDRTNILGKFWRNIPIADDSVDVTCLRDVDSALLTREEDAVREFLASDKLIHIMRDNPMHNAGMLAGMWCMKPVLHRSMARLYLETLLEQAKTYHRKTDQPLLNDVIYNTIKDKQSYIMQHDSYLCRKFKHTRPFPTQRRDNMEFVGCPNHRCNWPNLKACPIECRPRMRVLHWHYC